MLMRILSMRELDPDRFRADANLLEDAGLVRIGADLVQQREDGEPRTVVRDESWLARMEQRAKGWVSAFARNVAATKN